MKKLLLSLLILPTVFAQQSQLVNFEYNYVANGAYTGTPQQIQWNNFPDFQLASNILTTWYWNTAGGSSWDQLLSKGFNVTRTYDWQLSYAFSQGQSPIDSWQSPKNVRIMAYNQIVDNPYGGFEYMNQTKFNDAHRRYTYRFKTGGPLQVDQANWTFPPTPPLPYNFSNQQSIWPAFVDSAGIIVANHKIVQFDIESVANIENAWGWNGIDTYLECLKDPNCREANDYNGWDFQPWGPVGIEGNLAGMPNSYYSLSAEEFKKKWYLGKFYEYWCPFKAFHDVQSTSYALVGNYSSGVENNQMIGNNPNATWAEMTTNTDYLNYMARDTATFTQPGNPLIDATDYFCPDFYTITDYNNNYSYATGDYLSPIISKMEFYKAWFPNKKVIPSLWFKGDPYLDGGGQDVGGLPSPTGIEARGIFTVMCQGDGFVLWNGEYGTTNERHTEYLVKGLYRLSHFNHFLSDPNRIYHNNQDAQQIRQLEATGAQFGIWRAIVSGDSILVAATNPHAPSANFQTSVTISYNGWSDEITLNGREIFLGSARWNDGATTLCNEITLSSSIRSTCNGITTIKLPPTNSTWNVEYSLDGTAWQPSNWNGNGFEWQIPETTSCVPFWVRQVGCTAPVTQGCKIGSAPCLDPPTSGIEESTLTNVAIFPNPTENEFIIKSDYHFNNVEVGLFDLNGKQIYSSSISGKENTISLKNLVPGTYFLKLTSDNQTEQYRIVKK